MKKTYSEIQQERAGKLERNKAIVWRYQHDESQAYMARQYNLSRQRIWQICHRNQQAGFWGRFFKELWFWLRVIK